MKKKIALFFIAVFIVSLIPLGFADEGSGSLSDLAENNNTQVEIEQETEVEVKSESNSGRANAEASIRQEARIKAKENKEEFNNRLKALRNEHRNKIEALNKEKQEKFAELLNISRTHVGHVEQGRKSPSLELLEKIAKKLKIKAKDLIPY